MPAGKSGGVLSEKDAREFGVFDRAFWVNEPELFGCYDPSMGGDEFPFWLLGVGEVMNKGKMLIPLDLKYISPNMTQADLTGQMAIMLAKQAQEWGLKPENIAGDTSGQQGAICDTIERYLGAQGAIFRVRSEEKVSDRLCLGGMEKASQRYKNRATELYCNLADLIRAGRVCGFERVEKCHELLRQLDTRKLKMSDGKMEMEAKPDWRKRNAGKSPNETDAFAIGVDMLLERGIFNLAELNAVLKSQQNQIDDFIEPPAPTLPCWDYRSRRSKTIKFYHNNYF